MEMTSLPGSSSREREVTVTICQICYEPLSSDTLFDNVNCEFHKFCTKCISKYIEVKVEEYGVSDIECPGLDCHNLLDPLSCVSLLNKKTFVRWCDLLCYVAVSDLEKCYCPNPRCSVLVVNECGASHSATETKCLVCEGKFCFKCKIPWSESHVCRGGEEIIDMRDILFMEAVGKNRWVRCPSCFMFVERRIGCAIIMCRCRVQFCYYCGRRRERHSCDCAVYTREIEGMGRQWCTIIFVSFFGVVLLIMLFIICIYIMHKVGGAKK